MLQLVQSKAVRLGKQEWTQTQRPECRFDEKKSPLSVDGHEQANRQTEPELVDETKRMIQQRLNSKPDLKYRLN